FGMFEVFFDTIVICSLTCFAVLMSGVNIEYVTGDKNVLPIDAFATVFGEKFGSLSVAVSLLLFAFTTMITWSLYGVRCLEFLTGSRKFSNIYKIVFVAAVVYGATVPLGLAYRISDTLNGIMTIPNLVAVLGLSGTVTSLAKEYFSKNK
ncbi:MAG: alanine:cation symporter family protein, partial [Oscillospiraceae bacterium]|nr:alanine:cation symporter family protein [Oscillospiraceae bacterium]